MNESLNTQTITISMELAKDLFTLIHESIHPNYKSKVVESIKNQLLSNIQLAMQSKNEDSK